MGNASFVSHSQLLRLLSEFGHRLLLACRFLVLHQIGEPTLLAGPIPPLFFFWVPRPGPGTQSGRPPVPIVCGLKQP